MSYDFEFEALVVMMTFERLERISCCTKQTKFSESTKGVSNPFQN